MSVLDRSTPPMGGKPRAFDFPEVVRRSLPNGLDLRVGRMSRLPIVSVHLFMRAGETSLSPEAAGTAVLTADTLEGGSKRRTGSELARALERIGARVSASAGWEGTSLGLSCLADRLPDALGILAEMVLEPDFPEVEVTRARDQQLAQIRQRRMSPTSLATDYARTRYFAPGVPYARSVDGTEESVRSISRDTLRGFAHANYRPEHGGLIVVGDVDPDEVAGLVTERMGSWTGAPSLKTEVDISAAYRDRRVWLVHREGSVQSELRVGHVGAARSIPEYYPLSIANMVLGGMFTSRLNLNLRERNGFTYGVRSRFTFRTHPGPFQVSTAVGTDVTASAAKEIMHEVETMAGEGPTEEEVAAARDYSAGVFGLQLETAGQVATRISQLVVFGLPDDHFDRYRDVVRSVTRDEAAGAARKYIRPEEAQIVVVGNAEELAGPLEEAELGPVEVVSPTA